MTEDELIRAEERWLDRFAEKEPEDTDDGDFAYDEWVDDKLSSGEDYK